jgi:hypothetical protein
MDELNLRRKNYVVQFWFNGQGDVGAARFWFYCPYFDFGADNLCHLSSAEKIKIGAGTQMSGM